MHGGCISGQNFLSPQRYNYWCVHTYIENHYYTILAPGSFKGRRLFKFLPTHFHSGFDHPLQLHDMSFCPWTISLFPRNKLSFHQCFFDRLFQAYVPMQCLHASITQQPLLWWMLECHSFKSIGADENRHVKCSMETQHISSCFGCPVIAKQTLIYE